MYHNADIHGRRRQGPLLTQRGKLLRRIVSRQFIEVISCYGFAKEHLSRQDLDIAITSATADTPGVLFAMTVQDLIYLQIISGILCLAFGVSGGIFILVGKASPDKAIEARKTFGRLWGKIDGTVWLNLVRSALEQTVKFKNEISSSGFSRDLLKYCFSYNFVIGAFITLGTGLNTYIAFFSSPSDHDTMDKVGLLTLLFIMLGWTGLSAFSISKISDSNDMDSTYTLDSCEGFILFVNIPLFLLFSYLVIYEVHIFWFPILIIFVFPILYETISLLVGFSGNIFRGALSNKILENFTFYSFAIICSFILTFFAFIIGHMFDSEAWIPRTLRVLISNIVFDTITVFITFFLIEWSLKRKLLLVLPFVIILDLLLAAIFACGSLYIGLVLTPEQLTLEQIIQILFGSHPDGSVGLNLGPLFWAMHTVFIPTVIYMVMIVVFWCAKAFLGPVHWFLGVAAEHEKPLEITGYFLEVFFLFFAGLVPVLEGFKSLIETAKPG